MGFPGSDFFFGIFQVRNPFFSTVFILIFFFFASVVALFFALCPWLSVYLDRGRWFEFGPAAGVRGFYLIGFGLGLWALSGLLGCVVSLIGWGIC